MSTGTWLVLMVVSFLGGLAILEVVKLRNQIPGDHITAVVRKAIQMQPGPFIWFAFSMGFLAGHLAWW